MYKPGKVFILLSVILLIFSCNNAEQQNDNTASNQPFKPAAEEPKLPNNPPVEVITEKQQAIITFLTGDVTRLSDSEQVFAEIGDQLSLNDTIRVNADSYCEIQFGNRAVIRVEENTDLALSSLHLEQGYSKIGIELTAGSILCKVEKLAKDERFRVSTETAVCGVRGTEFRVSSSPVKTGSSVKKTVLSVQEGAVAITPPALDVEKLVASVNEKTEAITEMLEKIESSAVVVQADEEIDLTEDVFEQVAETVEKITEVISIIAASEEETVVSEKLLELQNHTEEVSAAVKAPPAEIRKISVENSEKLKALKDVRIINLPVKTISENEKTETPVVKTTSVYTLSVTVEPADSNIIFNSKPIGTGSFSGIFEEGETLVIDFTHEGYENRHYEITVSAATEGHHRIILDRLPEVDKTQTKPGPVEIKPETSQIKPSPVAVESIEPEPEPEPEPIEAFITVSSGNLTGSVSADSDLFYVADYDGTVTAITPEGNIAWKIKTENNSVENSFPSAGEGLLCFSGAAEYIILNGSSGRVISKKTLDAESAHIFGRRLVPTKIGLLLPTNNSIRILNPSDGSEIKAIPLPFASGMTPAFYNGKLLSVDVHGTFIVINPADGRILSSIPTGADQPIALSITINNGSAFFAGRKGTVVCIDLNSNRVLWEKQLPGDNQVFTDIICSRTATHVFSKGKIFSLDLKTGKEIFNAVEDASAPAAVIKNNLVYGSNKGKIILADASNGVIVKELDIDGIISTRPAVLDDRIAAGTESGKFLIINPAAVH